MKYRHCKRSSIAFILLGAITFGIYDIVVLSHVRKEANALTEGSGLKKQMPFFWAYLLGFITCGIVPLVWLVHVINKIQVAAVERKITSPRITKPFFVLWLILGSEIIIGPFIAFHRFFKVLNAVERYDNEQQEAAAKMVEAKEEMKEQMEAAPKAQEEAPQIKEPEHNENPYPSLPVTPSSEQTPIKRCITPRSDTNEKARPWRVKIGNTVKVFSTREEAVAYAGRISAERKAARAAKENKE
jgi:hypothetical protein